MYIKEDGVIYKVTKEVVDVETLEAEKVRIENELTAEEPTNKELVETGMALHPYYEDKSYLASRLAEIDKILETE